MIRNGPAFTAGGGPTTKRPRMEEEYGRYGSQSFAAAGGAAELSSRVLLVRNLKESIMEADLVDALSQFGPISYVSLTGRGTAMVEFEDLPAAERCIAFSMTNDVAVLGQPSVISYSPLQVIPRQGWESDRPNNVVVMYVQNPKYPITCDVISAICKPICSVVRIIINRENGQVQCLVEFADVEAARNIKQRLNGCDIYSGCCTLKIEFAKLTRLNVTRNDQDQADYVTPSAALDTSAFSKDRPALLQEPPVFTGGMMNPMPAAPFGGDRPDFGARPSFDSGLMPPPDRFGFEESGRGPFTEEDLRNAGFMGSGRPPVGPPGIMPFMPEGPVAPPDGCGFGAENAVVVLFGIDQEKFNCDKLFNLLCQYGNIVRIKFLKSKSDTVMVQMGDPVAAQRVMEFLNRCVVFGSKVSVSMSRQPYIHEMRDANALSLPDKSCSYKDFTNSRLNRFLTIEAASKCRMCTPQKQLYFYHAPPRYTSEDIMDIIEKNGGPKPSSVKVFDTKTEGAKTSAGIIEFDNEEDATEALVSCNHVSIDHESSKFPFVVKLSFAATNREPRFSDGGASFRGGPSPRGGGFRGRGGGRGRGDSDGGFSQSPRGGGFRGRGGGDFRGGRGGGDFRGGRGRGGPGGFRGGRDNGEGGGFRGSRGGGDFSRGRGGRGRGRAY